MAVEDEVLARLKERFPRSILESSKLRPRAVRVKVDRADLVELCFYLKEELGFDHLSCISAVDWKDKYESVYHLTRYEDGMMIQLSVLIPHDDPRVESLCKLWNSANFHEREAYDMMGIVYDHHPNLKRILLPEDSEFFPLRKDFPQEVERQYISRRKLRGGG